MDDDNDLNSDTEVVWVKSARGAWGMGHHFGNKLYFTRDIPEGKWVPKNLLAPAKPPTKKAKTVGDRHLVTVPQGVVGTVFPGVGNG